MARENTKDLPQRVASRIRENPETGCWEWTGAINAGGYGQLAWGRLVGGQARLAYVHRLVYHLLADQSLPVFPGRVGTLVLDHLCRVKRCVNPAHLEPVTQGENVKRHWESAEQQRLALSKLSGRSTVTASELAPLIGASHSQACSTLRRLERRGLVSIIGKQPGSSGRPANVWGVA